LVKIIKFFDADPEWKKVGSGIRSWHAVRMCFPLRIQDEQPGSYIETILWVKNSLMRIRDPGWKKFGSRITIPDPQPCRE
jgi:hypothetical protein